MKKLIMLAVAALVMVYQPAQAHSPQRPDRAALMAVETTNFLSTLNDEQKRLAVQRIDDQSARTSWHYLPSDSATRSGVSLAQLNAGQRQALHAMVVSALSSQGYGKLTHIMWLEEILRADAAAALKTADQTTLAARQSRLQSRDPSKYWVVVFGKPGSANWGWTLSGHHFAANFTVVGGRVAFTPLFLGANPQTVGTGEHAGERTLQHEIDMAFRLMRSLGPDLRRAAIVSANVPPTITADKGRQDAVRRFEGVNAGQLDSGQRALLLDLLDEFLDDTSREIAAAQKAAIAKDGFSRLHFAWWGQTEDLTQRFMYRIHGPSILIEFVREQAPDGTPANHVHSIVRDPRNDYGSAWLKQHYEEFHQPQP